MAALWARHACPHSELEPTRTQTTPFDLNSSNWARIRSDTQVDRIGSGMAHHCCSRIALEIIVLHDYHFLVYAERAEHPSASRALQLLGSSRACVLIENWWTHAVFITGCLRYMIIYIR